MNKYGDQKNTGAKVYFCPSTMVITGANVGFPLPSRLESVGSLVSSNSGARAMPQPQKHFGEFWTLRMSLVTRNNELSVGQTLAFFMLMNDRLLSPLGPYTMYQRSCVYRGSCLVR